MPTIKKLSLKLKSGLLSELQSDTIMGHFCWRLKDKFGVEKLREFISSYQNGNPVFTISNLLFEKDYLNPKTKKIDQTELFFPKPVLHIKNPGEDHKSKKEKINVFMIHKELKNVNLLTLAQFNLALNGKIKELYESLQQDKLERPKFSSDLKVSVEIDRKSFTSREGQLFSYYPKFLDGNTHVIFLLKILNQQSFNEFKCDEVLRDVFEVGFGKKKSSGFGEFCIVGELEDFNKFEEPHTSNAFITLGNYLPAAEDGISENSQYDFIIKYGKLGEELSLSEKPFKKPMFLFTPGSIFFTDVKKDFYGRITKNGEISAYDTNAVHFGIPLTLNLNLVP